MSYLIDTNVLSELRRKRPDPRVVSWLQARPRQSLFLSVLVLGEIRKGIERITVDSRRQALLSWLEVELPNYFLGRLLAIDGLLAATALQHDLTMVTRNSKDFAGLNLQLINPWDA